MDGFVLAVFGFVSLGMTLSLAAGLRWVVAGRFGNGSGNGNGNGGVLAQAHTP